MNLIHTTSLTDLQKTQARALADACREEEPLTLTAPSEDGLDYYLEYENSEYENDPAAKDGGLAGFSFLFFVPQEDGREDTAAFYNGEFTAFVHPKYRRQGYFSEMLNAALTRADQFEREHNCQVDFCFLTDEKSPAAAAVLEHIGAEYWYSEYKMTRTLRESDRNYVPRVQIAEEEAGPKSGSETKAETTAAEIDAKTAETGTKTEATEVRTEAKTTKVKAEAETRGNETESETETETEYASSRACVCTASLNGETIGSCALLSGSRETCLYAFQIKENLRGQGYGKDFLRGILALLARDTDFPDSSHAAGYAPPAVSVQVSGLNYVARNLYKKTGFRETESLSYYIY